MIDRPGNWIIRADGSEATHLGDVGLGGGRGYGGQWSPDSTAVFGIMGDSDGRRHLVRTSLSGERTWFDLPPAPPINPEIGPAPRWILDFRVLRDRIALTWERDDGFIGASIASLDLSTIHVEFDDDYYSALPQVSPSGDRFAFASGNRVSIVDRASAIVDGPFEVGPPESSVGLGAWSSNGASILVVLDGSSLCWLDLKTGQCAGQTFENLQAAAASPVDASILVEEMAFGGATRLGIAHHGQGTRPLTGDGGYAVWNPAGSQVAFGRSPYVSQRAGVASVHLIGADGSGERVLSDTRNTVVFPWGWSPDGQWIAVHLGGR